MRRTNPLSSNRDEGVVETIQ